MIKQEFFKIVRNRSVPSAFLLIVLMIGLAVFSQYVPQNLPEDSSNYMEEWGGPVTPELEERARELMREQDEQAARNSEAGAEMMDSPSYQSSVLHNVALTGQQKTAMKERLDQIDHALNGEIGTYETRKLEMEKGMLTQAVDVVGYYPVRTWHDSVGIIEPAFTSVLISVLLMIGLSPVFNGDLRYRMSGMVGTSRHGAKRLVTAKILASMLYATVIVFSLHAFHLLFKYMNYGSLEGWNAPFQAISPENFIVDFGMSPYSFTVWQYLVVMLGIQWFAALAFSMVVLLFSQLFRSGLIVFFAGLSLIAAPPVIDRLNTGGHAWLEGFARVNYTEMFRTDRMFQEFTVFQVFQLPVLHPWFAIMVYAVITIMVTLVLYGLHEKQRSDMSEV
ncbi:hypothetical protein [Alteribacter natronophilus]|uniref:hypothetical protein n=1 Tax=Alteribacter natronophilus TaxID=2583810 RepID=UPI00110EAA98|nr:hypothetical protein [Alteribacter natronophilus]TMW70361.1 hypothetical protein FGB90_16955 [Alteribacter natronophilus]